MTGYQIAALDELIEEIGEDNSKDILSTFSCPKNKDVESFLHNNAIEFSKQGLSKTFLVFTQFKGEPVFIGYFTLAEKTIIIKQSATFSSKLRKKLNKFTQKDPFLKIDYLSSPLIAQLGKNFTNAYHALITGDELLKMACDKVQEVHSIIGGKYVYLECEDTEKLLDFYKRGGFFVFDKRQLDRDEIPNFNKDYLLQMIKYFKINKPQNNE